MKVILLKSVPNLGQTGQVIEVKEGFARNYLIPKKLGVSLQSPEAQEVLRLRENNQKDQQLKKEEKTKKITDLQGKAFNFKVKVNKQGKLYSSVKPAEIAQKLALEEKNIVTGPIQDLGEHEVEVKLGGQKTKILITLEAEK